MNASITPLLTIPEVAAQLRASPQWVRLRIYSGVLKVHRVGGMLRISQDDLNDYLAQARQDPLRPRKKTNIDLSEVL
jgi:excisionase family DNA binding protein